MYILHYLPCMVWYGTGVGAVAKEINQVLDGIMMVNDNVTISSLGVTS